MSDSLNYLCAKTEDLEINRGGVLIKLCKEKVAFLPEQKALLISDIHLGKVSHFRKAGIGIPLSAKNTDFRNLNDVIELYQPTLVILMGDLFHSTYNAEWEEFKNFLAAYNTIDFYLVKGNHDIMAPSRYDLKNLQLMDDLVINDLIITHEPLERIPNGKYNIYGHIHPGVRIKGKSRQSFRLPCFHFMPDRAVFPAFGRLTGLAIVKVKKGDEVYVVSDADVIKMV